MRWNDCCLPYPVRINKGVRLFASPPQINISGQSMPCPYIYYKMRSRMLALA
jgi:hypothetical protein